MKPLALNPTLELSSAPGISSADQRSSGTDSANVRTNVTGSAMGSTSVTPAAMQRVREATSIDELRSAIAAAARDMRLATILVWYVPCAGRIGDTATLEGLLVPTSGIAPALREQLAAISQAAGSSQQLVTQPAVGQTQLLAVAMPIGNQAGDVLAGVIESWHLATSLSQLQLLAALCESWSSRQSAARAQQLAQTTAEISELTARIQAAPDLTAACQLLADQLQDHFAASGVFVGVCATGQRECRLRSVSGGRAINRLDPETRLIEAALQESLLRGASANWPAVEATNRHALLGHQQLAQHLVDVQLMSLPLVTDGGVSIGSVLLQFALVDDTPMSRSQISAVERFLAAAAPILASVLLAQRRHSDGIVQRLRAKCQSFCSGSRLQLAAWIASVSAVVLMLPVTYNVSARAELQPAARRFVAAPFAGPLQECFVEPGDLVSKDQLLATMDGREVRWELAEVDASLNKAIRERNAQINDREFGTAAITAKEIARLEQRRAMLQHRSESLEIRSPADGIVVSGDHREARGVPLDIGQTLFEIAPLDRMVIEVRVPESEVRHVAEGMNLVVQPDALPERSLDATLRNVHPRAELFDGENAFVAEADLPNPDGLLRPGMRGEATIYTERHMLGWNLFHKPVAWMLGWIGW